MWVWPQNPTEKFCHSRKSGRLEQECGLGAGAGAGCEQPAPGDLRTWKSAFPEEGKELGM